MRNIELFIDGETFEYEVADNWGEVSVFQAQELFTLSREDKTQIELVVAILSILSSIPEDYVYMLTPEQFSELTNVISFTNDEVVAEEVDSITIGEDVYYLKNDFSQMTMGEIISIDTLIGTEGNYAESMSKLLCIFLRKKLDNGSLESFKNNFMEREDMFGKLPISQVNNIFLFFLNGKEA